MEILKSDDVGIELAIADPQHLQTYLLKLIESDISLTPSYEAICRIFARCLKATSASLLLYRGRNNKVLNAGCYINSHEKKGVLLSKKYKPVFQNNLLHQFTDYWLRIRRNDFDGLTYSNFLEYCRHNNVLFHLPEQDYFEGRFLKSIKETFNLYNDFREKMESENAFSLDDPNQKGLVADVYKTYIEELSDNPYAKLEPAVFGKDLSNDQKPFTNILKRHEFVKDFEYDQIIYYPLVHKQRLFGLLRLTKIMRFAKNGRLIKNFNRNHRVLDSAIDNAVKLISAHIGKQYFINSLINTGKQDDTSASEDIYYRHLSSAYSSLINCFGCVIRLKRNEEYNVVGCTDNLKNYKDRLVSEGDIYKNNPEINKLYSKNTKNKIIALRFKISIYKDDVYQAEELRFYYYQTRIRGTDSINDILTPNNSFDANIAFPSKNLRIIHESNVTEVILFPIYNDEEEFAILSFANTCMRTFLDADVEIIYPYINRLKYELMAEIKKGLLVKGLVLSEVEHNIESVVEGAKNYIHDLKQKLKLINPANFIHQLNSFKENSNNELQKVAKLIDFANLLLLDKRLNNDIDISLEKNQFNLNNKKNIYLSKYLYKKIDLLRPYTAAKNKRLGIVKLFDKKDSKRPLELNLEILDSIILNLITNATKYSFDSNRRKKIPGYSVNYSSKSVGHIQVRLIEEKDIQGFEITNWGERLPIGFRINDIKLKRKRCTTNDKIKGDGMGCYYIDRNAKLLGAEFIPCNEDHEYKMRILWKK